MSSTMATAAVTTVEIMETTMVRMALEAVTVSTVETMTGTILRTRIVVC